MSLEYKEFIDLSYEPSKDELVALYRVTPAGGFDILSAASRVAAESSVGTWTEITTATEFTHSLRARVFEVKGSFVKIAYRPELFEEGSMSQIWSAIAGNIFGMKALKGLKLEDVYWPPSIVKSFPGPLYGIKGVRNILKIYDRPILATVPKPKVGLTPDEYAQAAYEIWIGGVDLVKDDENHTSMKFSRFIERVEKVLKARDKAEMETGERKGYLANITAPYNEMIKRAKIVKDFGGEFVMIDILTTGWSAVQGFREENEDLKLAVHAHRAFHAAFDRNPRHGVSMKVIAESARLVGVDHLHVGTVVGKLVGDKLEVVTLIDILRKRRLRESIKKKLLAKNWYRIKPVLPVSSGGLHPGLVPDILNIFGKEVLIQVGGGVTGHPDGPRAGATAVRQAIDAVLSGIPLSDYARDHVELARALEKWGYLKPV